MRALAVITLLVTACASATPEATPPPEATASASAVIPSEALSPAPLPSGRLAYGRFDGFEWFTFTSSPDGTDEQPLLSQSAEGARWAPDGDRLSVEAEGPQGLIFVGVVNADGSDYVQFDSPDPTLQLPCRAWSPNASRLVCEGWDDADPTRAGIYTVRASDGGDLTRVTTSPDGWRDIPGDYSPDGHQIVFIRWRPDVPDQEHNILMVVNVDGSNEHVLTDRKVGGAGSWSPDGTTILTDSDGSLWRVPLDGGPPIPIEIADAPNVSFASRGAWSPDGEWIVFSLAVETDDPDIYIMRSDGTNLHQVTDTFYIAEEFGDWG